MLRTLVEGLLSNEKNNKPLAILSKILIIVGIVCMSVLFPLFGKSYTINSKSMYAPFVFDEVDNIATGTVAENILEYLNASNHSIQSIYHYSADVLHLETYYQTFNLSNGIDNYNTSTNIITIVRAKHGYGRECIVIAYKHNYELYESIPFLGTKNTNKNTTLHIGNAAMALLHQYSLIKYGKFLHRLAV